jgi:hypothetical protein
MTRDTVIGDTPACFATSSRVGALLRRLALGLVGLLIVVFCVAFYSAPRFVFCHVVAALPGPRFATLQMAD